MKAKIAWIIVLAVAVIWLPRPATADVGDAPAVHRVIPSKAWVKPRVAPLRVKRNATLAKCSGRHRARHCRHLARRSFRINRWMVRHPYLWGAMVNSDGDITRWNPCVPITYTIDFSGAAPDQTGRTPQADWAWALARFETATGLDLKLASVGTPAAVAVRWQSTPGAEWEGEESTVAEPGWGAPAGVAAAFYASITFNAAVDTDGSRRDAMLHELGHLAGLGHVDDQRSVMRTGTGPMTEYSIGDLAGLWAMGAGGGCW